MRARRASAAAAVLAAAAWRLAAQAGFGFGEEASPDASPGAAPGAGGARIGGSLEVGALAFVGGLDALGEVELGELASARAVIEASGGKVDASVKLRLNRATLGARDPYRAVDEARLRLFAGPATIEGGLMKLAWGKADSEGPLDVTNPLDLTDLSVTDPMDRKIAVPMLRCSLGLGPRASVEAVFLPGFEGNRVATSGPWRPAALDALDARLAPLGASFGSLLAGVDSSRLEYSQAGLRLCAVLGPVDLGLQYFRGFLPDPAVVVSLVPVPGVELAYDRYQQAGVDAAAALAGFGLRAELAANLSGDLAGDDPAVYNPTLAFSLGFDRSLPLGLSLNAQYAGSWVLMDGKVDRSASSLDVDSAGEAFSSRATFVLSQGLLRDALSWELTALWGPQDEDWLLMPKLAYKLGDAEIELAAGFFGGDASGKLGQYGSADYLRACARYEF